MKLTKATVILAIVVGMSFQAFSQKQEVKFIPIGDNVYQLNYLKKSQGLVKVEIKNETGRLLYQENIERTDPFTKPFDFRNFETGIFYLRVSDGVDTYLTKINRSPEANMVASIIKYKDDKAKVIVQGDVMETVYINIYDRYGIPVFEDIIDRERGFSRIYDLSKINAEQARIEVASGDKVLATTMYHKE